ncbi:MAG: NUDIX hydrolase [Candidatus Tantalella remota]|nr:NUDIX hydrolase [Candidatus Tantalella remota]
MDLFKFCPICAATLEAELLEGRDRLMCKKCGWINYLNPLPVVSCLAIDDDGRVLLIKRGIEPSKGCWALPGGFIEVDETAGEAGCRELEEETGLKGKKGRLVGVRRHESPMYGPLIMVGVEMILFGGELKAGDDASDAAFYSPEDIPDIPFRSHRELISDYLNSD